MTFEIAYTLTVVSGVLAALASNRWPADAVMLVAMVAVTLGGIVTPGQALAGFSNPGLVTVAALYVVAAALRDTGAIYWIAHRLLGRPRSERGSLLRLVLPSGLLSAFLNNTTVVAMMIPAVQEWAKRLQLPPSRLLLPLSYATILGGTCTLIGTSTNLVVNGLMLEHGMAGFGLFDISGLGLALFSGGALFMVLFGQRLLPLRQALSQQLDNCREYRVEMTVPEGSALQNKSIQQSGLRALAHGRLTEILRDNHTWMVPAPEMMLRPGDRLAFVGAPECVRELQCIRGVRPAHDTRQLGLASHRLQLVEVVIGPGFPGLGQSVRESAFGTRYRATILGISRSGQRLAGRVRDVVLHSGDTLLLQTDDSFVEQYQFRRDFMLTSPLTDSTPPDFSKAPLALALLLAMVVANATGLLDVLQAAFLAGAALLATGCVSITQARQNLSVNLPVLLVIGASCALGAAVQQSGTARWLVDLLFASGGHAPWAALLGVYLLTALCTELITNNAAAVLMFPLAVTVAGQLGVDATPFIVAVMFAASASFLTPIGYQTNLMVMGPGGYRPLDYVRFGLPLAVVACVISVVLIPLFWPF